MSPAPSPARPAVGRRSACLGLLFALGLYLALRAALLHFAFDQTAMPYYELYPMGTVPALVLEGSEIPLHLHYDNAAGQLLTGLLAVPFYALLGAEYLSLKLVPALLGLLLVLVAYLLLEGAFSRRAALLGALLLALGPAPLLLKYSLMASGNHFENLLFSALALLCAYRFHRAPRRRGVWLVLTGLTCGLAVFVFLGALLPIALLALVHLSVRGGRGTLRDARLLVPALIVGASPLILLNLGTSGRGASFLEAKFGDARHLDPARVVERVREFLLVDLPKAPGFEDFLGVPASVFSVLLLCAAGLAWCLALPPALAALGHLLRSLWPAQRTREEELRIFERAKFLPFALLLPLTALAFGLSNFVNGGAQAPVVVAGYRYFLPSLLLASLLVAARSARLIEAGGARRAAGWALIGAALLAGLSNLALLAPTPGAIGIGTRYAGTNFTQMARQLVSPKNALPVSLQVHHADALPALARHQTYVGIGFCRAALQWRRARREGRPEAGFLDLGELLEGLPREAWVDAARGAGSYLGFEAALRADGRALVRASLEAILEGTPHPYARFVPEGVPQPADYPPTSQRVPTVLARAHAQLEAAAPAAREPLARGLGLAAGRLLRRGIAADEDAVAELLPRLPADLERSVAYGLGWGLADEREPPAVPAAARLLVADPQRPFLLRGYGAGLRHVHGAARAREWVRASLPPAEHAEALHGIEGLGDG